MTRKFNYLELLIEAVKKYQSNVSFGLDPALKALPKGYAGEGINGFFLMLVELFAYMKEQKVFPGAFKPNYGYYSIYGSRGNMDFEGLIVLCKIMNLIEMQFPGMPQILDFKRADIQKSSDNYADEGFHFWDADAVTIAPYMGDDSMLPFAEYCGMQVKLAENRGVYVLNLTSNPGAQKFQMLDIADGKKLYMNVAGWIRDQANFFPGLGAVVGAPNLEGLYDIAKYYMEGVAPVPLLIPGVAKQGGTFDGVISTLDKVGYDKRIVRINLSSGSTHPWGEIPAPDDWKKIIVDNLFNYNKMAGLA